MASPMSSTRTVCEEAPSTSPKSSGTVFLVSCQTSCDVLLLLLAIGTEMPDAQEVWLGLRTVAFLGPALLCAFKGRALLVSRNQRGRRRVFRLD